MGRVLIVYYSRTGNTEKAAMELAKNLNADVEKLVDCENRKGARGYFKGRKHASERRLTVIEQPRYNPSDYDVVVLGTPTWSTNMSPAVRTYIHYNKNGLRKVAFLVTQGGACNGKVYEEMRDPVGKLPVAALDVSGKEFKEGAWQYKVKEIAAKIKFILM